MATNFNVTRVVLCGSFRKDQRGLLNAYHELIDTNCQVLSPHSLDFDDQAFVRDPATLDVPARTLEEYHLMSIRQADFVWLHAPDGYVGLSGAFEIGYAIAHHIPVFTRTPLQDGNLCNYVEILPSVFDAKQRTMAST
jgi:nucleoside 2-deoxyribosyltransferase